VPQEYLGEGNSGHVPASLLDRFFLSDSPGAELPPRAILAASQFADSFKAVLLKRGVPPEADEALYELLNPFVWRVRLLKPIGRGEWEGDLSGDQYDELVDALARCWTIILRPCLKGQAQLDVQQLLTLKRATDRKDTAFHE